MCVCVEGMGGGGKGVEVILAGNRQIQFKSMILELWEQTRKRAQEMDRKQTTKQRKRRRRNYTSLVVMVVGGGGGRQTYLPTGG